MRIRRILAEPYDEINPLRINTIDPYTCHTKPLNQLHPEILERCRDYGQRIETRMEMSVQTYEADLQLESLL